MIDKNNNTHYVLKKVRELKSNAMPQKTNGWIRANDIHFNKPRAPPPHPTPQHTHTHFQSLPAAAKPRQTQAWSRDDLSHD